MKRQRTYRDDTNVEHNGQDYQDNWDNEMERRSEEDRLNKEIILCDTCTTPVFCIWFGKKCEKPLTSK